MNELFAEQLNQLDFAAILKSVSENVLEDQLHLVIPAVILSHLLLFTKKKIILPSAAYIVSLQSELESRKKLACLSSIRLI